MFAKKLNKIFVSIGHRLLLRVYLLLNTRNLGRFYANSEGNVWKTKVAIQVRIIHPSGWVKIIINSCRTSFSFYIKEESRESSSYLLVDSDSSCPKMMAIQAISPQRLAILKKLIVAKISIVCSSVIVVASLFRHQSPVCQVSASTVHRAVQNWWLVGASRDSNIVYIVELLFILPSGY